MAAVQATEGFVRSYAGADVTVRAGDILDDSHEIVRTTPAEWWRPIGDAVRFVDEEATAKPKRKRAVGIDPDAADE